MSKGQQKKKPERILSHHLCPAAAILPGFPLSLPVCAHIHFRIELLRFTFSSAPWIPCINSRLVLYIYISFPFYQQAYWQSVLPALQFYVKTFRGNKFKVIDCMQNTLVRINTDFYCAF